MGHYSFVKELNLPLLSVPDDGSLVVFHTLWFQQRIFLYEKNDFLFTIKQINRMFR